LAVKGTQERGRRRRPLVPFRAAVEKTDAVRRQRREQAGRILLLPQTANRALWKTIRKLTIALFLAENASIYINACVTGATSNLASVGFARRPRSQLQASRPPVVMTR
jgi:hypothetical protein